MLKINLLPQELRKKKKKRVVVFEVTQTLLILIIVCEIVAFLGIYVFISVKAENKQKELRYIRTEIEGLQPKVREVRFLEEDAKKLEKRIQIIDQLMFSRVSWARKLNEISDLIPNNMWLTSLNLSQQTISQPGGSLVPENILILKGKVIALPGEKAIDLIGVFMNKLKFNPSFSEVFNNIEFIGTSTEKIGDKEVFGFELHCK